MKMDFAGYLSPVMHEILREAPFGIFQLDRTGELVFANTAFCKLAGESEKKLLGSGWTAIIGVDDGKVLQMDNAEQADPQRRLTTLISQVPVRIV